MKGMDLFLAVNDVNDSYIAEAAGNAGKAQIRGRVCKMVTAAAIILLMIFAGNKVLFLNGHLKYKVVKVSNAFQAQDESRTEKEMHAWEQLPPDKRYPRLCMEGLAYDARFEACDEKELGQLLGTFPVEGTKYVRIGVLLYFDMEILHGTKADVYEITGEEPKNAVAVRFEESGECYVYDRSYK